MVGLSDAAGLFEDSLSEGSMGTNQQPPPSLPPPPPPGLQREPGTGTQEAVEVFVQRRRGTRPSLIC